MFLQRENKTTLSQLRIDVSLSSASIVLTEWKKNRFDDESLLRLEMHF